MKTRLLFAFASLLLAGCASFSAPESFRYQEIDTEFFRLASWQKLTDAFQPVRIYIEGDGYAFNAHGRPSSNPAPRETDFRALAFGDPHANVVYLARPCQYVEDSRCNRSYWSTARFSSEVIASVSKALEALAGSRPITLIGYSGGAQVAGLAAVTDKKLDVQKIVTIAGNLDHQAWCRHHKLPLLNQSLDLTRYWSDFEKIEQTHFLCDDDEVIPAAITLRKLGPQAHVVHLPEATHSRGWLKFSELIYAQ